MLKTNFYAKGRANTSLRTKCANLIAIFEDYNKITHNIKMKIKYIKNLLNEMAGGAGRNDDAMAATLTAVAQVVPQAQGNGGHGQKDQGEVEERSLDRFMRNKPPTFKGRFDLEGALTWKESMERIFRVMVTYDDQKVRLVTHMLVEEAEYWWTSTKRRIESSGDVITWVRFKNEFLKKYFPEDLRNKKEAEFLNLKQGNLYVAEYAAKYEELLRFCPYINAEDAIVSKCFINSTPLITIINTSAKNSFISSSCVERLGLVVTPLSRGMVIDTLANGSVTTSLVCVVDFELDLVCLPLKHMDVIFAMDWMLTFSVNINCLTKSVTFSKSVDEVGGKFLTAEQVKKSLDGEASLSMMFASLKESREKGVGDLPVVQEFLDVFPEKLPTYHRREKLSLQLIWCQERVMF